MHPQRTISLRELHEERGSLQRAVVRRPWLEKAQSSLVMFGAKISQGRKMQLATEGGMWLCSLQKPMSFRLKKSEKNLREKQKPEFR